MLFLVNELVVRFASGQSGLREAGIRKARRTETVSLARRPRAPRHTGSRQVTGDE